MAPDDDPRFARTEERLDPRAAALLAAEGLGDLFHDRQHAACTLADRYALACAVDVAHALGLPALLGVARTPAEAVAAGGFVPAFARPLGWLCARLAHAGLLVRDGDAHRVAQALPVPPRAALRAAGLAVDASYAPAYDLLDEAAAVWPRVARGETVAERALFLRVRLWRAYFDNANAYYALQNHVAARAAAARLRAAGGGPVVEVGAGLGSAAEALLVALGDDAPALVRGYAATEPVPFFRRLLAERLAAPLAPLGLVVGDLDVGRPWAAQGVAPGSATLVWGVNVFHLAADLDAALAEAVRVLRPGGWLVVGEGVRPRAVVPVDPELPFQLLASFGDVRLDPATRPTAGFLTAPHWEAALRRAGLVDVASYPDVARLHAVTPVFLGAAICGRRPAA